MHTSCPECGAPAHPGARACHRCGYLFVEAAARAKRPRFRWALALAVLAGGVATALALSDRKSPPVPNERSGFSDVLSERPLSAHAAELRLEARLASLRDDPTVEAHCSRREAKPVYSLRRCVIGHGTAARRVLVIFTDVGGRELLRERGWLDRPDDGG